MSVSGILIEVLPVRVDGADLSRLRVLDPATGDELWVYARPFTLGPALGEPVWWQEGKIYFDHDRRALVKVGSSETAGPRP